MSRELSVPLLSSDVIGGTIRRSLGEGVATGTAFRAGFEVLFTLAEAFVASGCPVILDMNMGWDFQWERVAAIVSRRTEVGLVPIVLRCPYQTCLDRITAREADEAPDMTPARAHDLAAARDRVWAYLDQLDRPDIHNLDAGRDAESVYTDAMQIISTHR